jgi:hypothetical protein
MSTLLTTKVEARQMFTTEQLDQLRASFARINTAPIHSLPIFRQQLAAMHDRLIEQVIGADIKFLSKLAINERTRRAA